jgi:hypothetical protein
VKAAPRNGPPDRVGARRQVVADPAGRRHRRHLRYVARLRERNLGDALPALRVVHKPPRNGRLALAALALAAAACSQPGPAETAGHGSAHPAPTFYIGDQFTATQQAAQAVADAGTIWLLDANGDFVYGADPGANWNAQTGLALEWKQVPGAAKYHVLARNTLDAPTAWKELLVVAAPDPVLHPTVIATGVNPWTAGLGTGGNPWSFGNHVQLAVSAEDSSGVITPDGLTDPLDVADAFPGVVTGVEIDRPGLPVPFDPRVERGSTFAKTIRLTFSEPMSTDAAPALTSRSVNLAIRRVRASAWGDDPGTPSASPPSAAAHAFLSVELAVKGACAEVLVPRAQGDVVLVVSEVSHFSPGPGGQVLFLDGASGALLGEATGIASADATSGQVALGAPLATDLPVGSLACSLSGPVFAVPRLVLEAGTRLAVGDATPFFVGEQVAVYEPPAGGAGSIYDLRRVSGVDTVDGTLVLSAPLSAGHGSHSLVLPLNGVGGEVALRPSAGLVLQRDASGGPDTELFLAGPTSTMVGDTVLVDADGLLQTTADQEQATVKQVRFAPDGTASYSILVDLPPSLMLLHGRALVIGLGDSFAVAGTRDTSAAAATPLDPHGDQFSADGLRF